MKVILFCLFLFALFREIKEQPNCYLQGEPKDGDDIATICKKIYICLQSETKAIKWRRCLLISVTSLILIFTFIYSRIPSNAEIILILAVIYTTVYVSMQLFTERISSESVRLGKANLSKLRKVAVLQVHQSNPDK